MSSLSYKKNLPPCLVLLNFHCGKINMQKSLIDLTCGVPQGTLLGLILFYVFHEAALLLYWFFLSSLLIIFNTLKDKFGVILYFLSLSTNPVRIVRITEYQKTCIGPLLNTAWLPFSLAVTLSLNPFHPYLKWKQDNNIYSGCFWTYG